MVTQNYLKTVRLCTFIDDKVEHRRRHHHHLYHHHHQQQDGHDDYDDYHYFHHRHNQHDKHQLHHQYFTFGGVSLISPSSSFNTTYSIVMTRVFFRLAV